MADRIVGLTAVGGILAALMARERTGRGQRLDVPMFETMVGFVLGDHLGGLTFDPPLDEGGYARQLSHERRPYRTSDGYICALIYNDKQWQGFLRAIGRESLLEEDARFATFANRSRHIDFVYGELARIFEQRSTAEWMKLLEEADVPMMPMHDLKSVLDDPHLVATKFFTTSEHPTEGTIRSMRMPLMYSESTPEPTRPAPRLGEHSVEVLADAGYSGAEIAALIAQGAVLASSAAAPGAKGSA
jgi:formyl-CoA transferase